MNTPMKDALALVKQCQIETNQKLTEANLPLVKLEINKLFERIITRLGFSGAVVEPENGKKETGNKFPPIKSWMGREVTRAPKVTLEQLTPAEADLNQVRDNVRKLYNSFLKRKPDEILRSHKLPEDILILRGVAKWAGVEDYETKDLNIPFMEDIALAIMEKQDLEKKQDKFQKELSNDRKLVTVSDGAKDDDGITVPATDATITAINPKPAAKGK